MLARVRVWVSANRHLLILASCITVLHLCVFFGVASLMHAQGQSMLTVVHQQDEWEYVQLGESLLSTGRFEVGDLGPNTFRTPGYPALVALILSLTGSLWTIYVFHAFVTGLAAAATARIAELLGLPRRWSIAAGILFGVGSGAILLTAAAMGTDKIFTLLYALAAIVLLSFSRRATLIRAACMGAILGIATLVRPIGILASLPLLVGILFIPSKEILGAYRVRIAAFLVAVALFALVLIPWYARNYAVAGHFSLSSLPTFNFVYYNIPLFFSQKNGTGDDAERAKLLAPLGNPPQLELKGFAYHERLAAIQKEFLRDNAFPYAVFHAYKMIPFFAGSGFNTAHAIIARAIPSARLSFFPTEDENLTRALARGDIGTVVEDLASYPLVTLERLSWLLIFALVFLSPLFVRGRERRFLLLSCVVVLSFAFLSSPVIEPRYRVPAEPFIWVAAVYSVYALTRWRAERRRSTLPV